MVEKVAKIKVPTVGFYGGKQMHGLRHVEARFLKKHIQTKMVLACFEFWTSQASVDLFKIRQAWTAEHHMLLRKFDGLKWNFVQLSKHVFVFG